MLLFPSKLFAGGEDERLHGLGRVEVAQAAAEHLLEVVEDVQPGGRAPAKVQRRKHPLMRHATAARKQSIQKREP